MNLQRREEIRVIAEYPNDMHWAQEMRRAVAELLAHIDTLESMRSRLCAALGLPADSAPETVAESLGLREPPAVVVPELTEEDLVRAGGPYCINDREPFQRGARWAAAFIRENARAIHADRVLGDGMVAVDRSALLSLFYVDDNGGPRFPTPREKSLLDALRPNQGGAAT